jgi:hypothetical protein
LADRLQKAFSISDALRFWVDLYHWDRLFLRYHQPSKESISYYLSYLFELPSPKNFWLQEQKRLRQKFLNAILAHEDSFGLTIKQSPFDLFFEVDQLILSKNYPSALDKIKDTKWSDLPEVARLYYAHLTNQVEKQSLQEIENSPEFLVDQILSSEKLEERISFLFLLYEKHPSVYQDLLKKEKEVFKVLLEGLKNHHFSLSQKSSSFWRFHLPFFGEDEDPYALEILKLLSNRPWFFRDAYQHALQKNQDHEWPSWNLSFYWASRFWGSRFENQFWDSFVLSPCQADCSEKFRQSLSFLQKQGDGYLTKWLLTEEENHRCLLLGELLERLGRTMSRSEALYKSAMFYMKCGDKKEQKPRIKELFRLSVNLGDSEKIARLAQWALDRM